jgi:thiol-disulfide isomerase/thioredoxin
MGLYRWGAPDRVPAVSAVALAVVSAVAVAALAGCSGGGSGGVGVGSGTSFVAGDGAVTIVAPKDRRQPVNLSGRTVEGDQVELAAYRGHPVVVNVWGSWCGPCRQEAPDLQAAYTELKPSGVVFLGIDTRDDDPAQARAFQESFGITYPSVVDSGGAVLLGLRGAVSPSAVPTTLVLDEQGRVAARVSGPADTTTLVGLVHDTRLSPGAGT